MSIRVILFSAAALVLGGGTLLFGQNLLQDRADTAAKSAEAKAPLMSVTKILVAARTLTPGTLVVISDLAWREWPTAALHPTYIRAPSGSLNFSGQIVRTEMLPGEPVTAQRLVATGSRGALAAVTEPGRRAVSISLNPTSGVSGLILPGDRVDVVLTYALPRAPEAMSSGVERRAAATILTDLRVLAVDQRLSGAPSDTKDIRNASLEVTVQQSEALALAADLGKLSLSLRGITSTPDDAVATSGSSTLDYQVARLLPKLSQPTRGGDVVRHRQAVAGPSLIEFHGGAVTGAGSVR